MWASIPIFCWPAAWLSLWLCGSGTTLAWKLSGAALQCGNRPRSSPLLKLHVSTLKLKPNAGKRQPYAMRGEPLRLVPRR